MLNCVHGAKHHDSVKKETLQRRRVDVPDVPLKTSQLLMGARETTAYIGD